MWRPDFPYSESRPGWVEGWERRFWQGSTDHRGVPGAPGRVVTLVPVEAGLCWGRVYRLEGPDVQAALAVLDYREKGGYERIELEVRLGAGEAVRAITYRAGKTNPNYLGPASCRQIARHIVTAAGPSGRNPEYVFRLAEVLRTMGVQDPHVFGVEAELHTLMD